MDKYISPFTPSKGEIERRYTNVRKAMQSAGLDYLIVSGSEYTGFEGAVRYMCGFHILHRYAYVVVPMKGDPIFVTPREATWVGDHSQSFCRGSRRGVPPGGHLGWRS
jgi:Xaa-Pro dipeptidase